MKRCYSRGYSRGGTVRLRRHCNIFHNSDVTVLCGAIPEAELFEFRLITTFTGMKPNMSLFISTMSSADDNDDNGFI